MIPPSVGRVVWFRPSTQAQTIGGLVRLNQAEPLAAIVTHVWSDRMVNLAVFDSNGAPHGKTSVQLLQDDDVAPATGYYCEWMPFQKGQAAKTEQLEARRPA